MQAFRALYREGGVVRFYRGYFAALAQGSSCCCCVFFVQFLVSSAKITKAPLARFGDTAANMGVLTLLSHFESTKNLDPAAKTLAASVSVGAFRMFLMPIDAVKTSMQVGGKEGFPKLMLKIRTSGIGVLWHGAFASSAASMIG